MVESINLDFKPLNNGWGIQPLGSLLDRGDVHETFRTDPTGAINGGHTTVRFPGGEDIRIPWDVPK